jgi:ABC-type amino acid transport substrate-binding protein
MTLNAIPNANFGILLPKNSKLKEKIDPIIKYYVKTSRFYQLVKKYFGEDASNYFKNL